MVGVSCLQCGANEKRDGGSIDPPSQRVRERLRRSANRQAGGAGVVAWNRRDVLEGLHLPADLLSGFQPVGLPGRSLALLAAQLERRGELVEARSQLLEAFTLGLHGSPPVTLRYRLGALARRPHRSGPNQSGPGSPALVSGSCGSSVWDRSCSPRARRNVASTACVVASPIGGFSGSWSCSPFGLRPRRLRATVRVETLD